MVTIQASSAASSDFFNSLLVVSFTRLALRGVSILLTWNWFVAPVLKAPSLNFIEAIGFSFFVTALFPMAWRSGGIYDTGTPFQILKSELRLLATTPLVLIIVAFYWHWLTTL